MKKILISVVLMLVTFFSTVAQQIVAAEYFFDTDPGIGNGIPVSISPAADTVTLQINANVSGLNPGQHYLSLRTKDAAGTWSLHMSRVFYINPSPPPSITQQIVQAEYFFDTDPGPGSAMPFSIASPADTINSQMLVSVAGLNAGQHYFCLRTKNADGVWSLQQSRLIYVNPAPPSINQGVIQAEYFFDNDPGIGNGIPVNLQSNDTVISSFNIINPFTSGSHYLVLRTKDFDGNWSLHSAKKFNVCANYGANSDFTTFNDRRTVYFNNISQYDTAFYWNFDDGNVTTVKRNPVHQYSLAGIYNVSLVSYNACATDTFTQAVIVNGIQSIFPAFSADTNFYVGHIRGLGFQPGCVIKLNKGGTTLIADSTIYISDTDLKVIFKFNLPPVGFYNVIANNPLGILDTLINAFEIQTLRPSKLLMTRQGINRARTGRNSTQNYSIRNDGNTTLYMIPVFILYPDTSALSVTILNDIEVDASTPASLFPFIPPDNSYEISDPWNPDLPGMKMVAALIPYLGPGEEYNLGYRANSSVPECWNIEVKAKAPLFDSPTNPFSNSCTFLPSGVKCAMDVLGLVPALGCGVGLINLGCNVYNSVNDTTASRKKKAVDFVATLAGTLVSCVGLSPASALWQASKVGGGIAGGAGLVADCNEAFNSLYNGVLANELPSESTQICWSNSYDPNEKYGPQGITADNYISKWYPLGYAISFENVDTATAPAAEVIITDTLDITKFDLSTFRFTNFGFGDTSFVAPDEITNEWVTDIDLRSSHSIWLRSNAFLDLTTGILKWNFTSYDTITFDLVSDPQFGFLPPNVNAPEGEGFIGYSLKTYESLQHGDVIINRATIVFDNNAPVATSDYINTIDTIKPSSTILSLSATQTDTLFRIHINGSDANAGVKDYFIYTSINDSIFKLFASGCPYDSLLVHGIANYQYEFFSQARDRAYNLEDTVHVPDAVTIVTVGIEEPNPDYTFNIYPNPASHSITVNAEVNHAKNIRMNIYSITGKKVKQIDLIPGTATEISLDGLSSGLYQIQIDYNGKFSLVKKLIRLQ